jgi:hypothetical protein
VTGQGAGWVGQQRGRGTSGWREGSEVRICDCEPRSSATCASASAYTAEVLFAQPIRLYSIRTRRGGGRLASRHSYCEVAGYGSRERRFPSNDRRPLLEMGPENYGLFLIESKGCLALLVSTVSPKTQDLGTLWILPGPLRY